MRATYPKPYAATASLGEVYHYTSLNSALAMLDTGRLHLSTTLGTPSDALRVRSAIENADD